MFHLSWSFYAVILVLFIPAILFTSTKIKLVIRILKTYSGQNSKAVTAIEARFVARSFCWICAWICACIALIGPSWGTELVPVQKSGSALCFVFDVSYSMMAQDANNSKTLSRLEHSKEFSTELLTVLPGVAASAVLTKGEGVLAVPLTEDYYALANVIEALAPNMLSAPGSSLSKGILKAIESFPPQSARSSSIVVMSDGDDTDEGLADAVKKAISFGISVVFVGYGSTDESEVLAGDGETYVKTALREEKLKSLAKNELVYFMPANEQSSLENIVRIVNPTIIFGDSPSTTSYETIQISRHGFFITLAIILFLLGLCVYTFVPKNFIRLFASNSKSIVLLLLPLWSVLFSGCSDWAMDAGTVLEGSYNWNRQNYQQAVASFLEVHTRSQETGNLEMQQYGLFGLSASYIMQGEIDASLIKINEMEPLVSPSLDFARWYNKGIIFHRRGDYETAAFCFKKALLVDSTNINAKINLELSSNEKSIQAQQGVQERIPVEEKKESSGASDAVFSLIRENEGNQWENYEATPEKSNIIDY